MKEAHSTQHTAHNFQALDQEAQAILGRYEEKKAAMLPLLRLVQEQYGYVTPEGEQWVAEQIGTTPAHVREVVTFYTLFRRQPVGKYHIQVCSNMSCWLAGCSEIIRYLEEKLQIKAGETTPDRRFTLSTVECLCACEIAPMLQLNDQYVGPLTKASVDNMLAECLPAPPDGGAQAGR